MNKIIIFSFVAIFFISCNKTNHHIFLNKSLNYISFNKEIELQGEKIEIDNFGAVDLLVMDTFLIFITPQLDQLYSIFSTTTHTGYGQFINQGQGPNEFLRSYEPLFMETKQDEKIIVFNDYNRREMKRLNLTKTLETNFPHFEPSVNLKDFDNIYKLYSLNDTEIFIDYLHIDPLDQHFCIYNIENKKVIRDDLVLQSNIKSISESFLLATCYQFNKAKKCMLLVWFFLTR